MQANNNQPLAVRLNEKAMQAVARRPVFPPFWGFRPSTGVFYRYEYQKTAGTQGILCDKKPFFLSLRVIGIAWQREQSII
jgi:uncharacterized membrane protein